MDASAKEGEGPVLTLSASTVGLQAMSRVPWEWSANRW